MWSCRSRPVWGETHGRRPADWARDSAGGAFTAAYAAERDLPFLVELQRVIIHGVLHLCGYGDKTPKEAEQMRELEEEALAMLA